MQMLWAIPLVSQFAFLNRFSAVYGVPMTFRLQIPKLNKDAETNRKPIDQTDVLMRQIRKDSPAFLEIAQPATGPPSPASQPAQRS